MIHVSTHINRTVILEKEWHLNLSSSKIFSLHLHITTKSNKLFHLKNSFWNRCQFDICHSATQLIHLMKTSLELLDCMSLTVAGRYFYLCVQCMHEHVWMCVWGWCGALWALVGILLGPRGKTIKALCDTESVAFRGFPRPWKATVIIQWQSYPGGLPIGIL